MERKDLTMIIYIESNNELSCNLRIILINNHYLSSCAENLNYLMNEKHTLNLIINYNYRHDIQFVFHI